MGGRGQSVHPYARPSPPVSRAIIAHTRGLAITAYICPAQVIDNALFPATPSFDYGDGVCIQNMTGNPIRQCTGTGEWSTFLYGTSCTRA